MKSCFNRDYKARPGIPELLKHPYVTGGPTAAAETADGSKQSANSAVDPNMMAILQQVAEGKVNAEDVLNRLQAGATTEDLSEVVAKSAVVAAQQPAPAPAPAPAPRAPPAPAAPSVSSSSFTFKTKSAAAAGGRDALHAEINVRLAPHACCCSPLLFDVGLTQAGKSNLKKASHQLQREPLQPGEQPPPPPPVLCLLSCLNGMQCSQ